MFPAASRNAFSAAPPHGSFRSYLLPLQYTFPNASEGIPPPPLARSSSCARVAFTSARSAAAVSGDTAASSLSSPSLSNFVVAAAASSTKDATGVPGTGPEEAARMAATCFATFSASASSDLTCSLSRLSFMPTKPQTAQKARTTSCPTPSPSSRGLGTYPSGTYIVG